MRAFGHQPAFVQHQDFVGVEDGADALGDDERGVPVHQRGERVLNVGLGRHVHGAGAVVQNEDGRFAQQRAGNRNALLLPAG